MDCFRCDTQRQGQLKITQNRLVLEVPVSMSQIDVSVIVRDVKIDVKRNRKKPFCGHRESSRCSFGSKLNSLVSLFTPSEDAVLGARTLSFPL